MINIAFNTIPAPIKSILILMIFILPCLSKDISYKYIYHKFKYSVSDTLVDQSDISNPQFTKELSKNIKHSLVNLKSYPSTMTFSIDSSCKVNNVNICCDSAFNSDTLFVGEVLKWNLPCKTIADSSMITINLVDDSLLFAKKLSQGSLYEHDGSAHTIASAMICVLLLVVNIILVPIIIHKL
jgi:hypothetical protein